MEGEVMSVDEWCASVHELAVKSGWWDGYRDGLSTDEVLAKLALVHSEISEALEVARVLPAKSLPALMHGEDCKPEGFGVELADAVIRIMDLCGALEIDLERCMSEKHQYNKSRSRRHGGKLA